MMERYKEDMNQIHAPEALIQSTLHKIEQQQVNKPKKMKKRVTMVAGGLAAAVVLAVGAKEILVQPSYHYNSVMQSEFRNELTTTEKKTMSVEEYSKYLGVDLHKLIGEANLSNANIEVTYEKDQKTVQSEEAILYYVVKEQPVMVKLSKTTKVAPENLLKGEASTVDDQIVYLGTIEGNERLCAAGSKGKINYYIMSESKDKKTFETILKKIIKNI